MEDFRQILPVNRRQLYSMMIAVARQLIYIYDRTGKVFTDMKLGNVLYRGNPPTEYLICDFGSFFGVGEDSTQTYPIPFNAQFQYLRDFDAQNRPVKERYAHIGFGIWSLFILLDTALHPNPVSTLRNDVLPSVNIRRMTNAINYPYMNTIIYNLYANRYTNPYTDSINDFLRKVAHPRLFRTDDPNIPPPVLRVHQENRNQQQENLAQVANVEPQAPQAGPANPIIIQNAIIENLTIPQNALPENLTIPQNTIPENLRIPQNAIPEIPQDNIPENQGGVENTPGVQINDVSMPSAEDDVPPAQYEDAGIAEEQPQPEAQLVQVAPDPSQAPRRKRVLLQPPINYIVVNSDSDPDVIVIDD
jgi:hypothetical protein